MSKLWKQFEKDYIEPKGAGVDRFWIDYAESLEALLTWKNTKDELPPECETVWMENSRYYGAGRLVNGEWFTHDGNEVNAPWRWLSISKENKNENNINWL